MNLEFIFKVIDKEEWLKAKQSGTYGGSEKDLKDEIKYTYDKDLLDELIDNVTTPTTTKKDYQGDQHEKFN